MISVAVTLALFARLAVPTSGFLSERIVFPVHLESRADTGERVVRITDDIVLNLQKTSLFGPEVTVVGFDDDNNEVSLSMPGAEAEKDLYHDSKQLAAVHMSHEEGFQVVCNRFFPFTATRREYWDPRYRIQPLPAAARSSEGHVAHLLFEIEEKRQYDTFESRLRRQLQRRDLTSDSNSKLRANKPMVEERIETVIYPELTIFCDAPFSEHFRHNYTKILRYMTVFMTCVNLRYTSLADPYVWNRPVYIVALNRNNEIYLALNGDQHVYDSTTLDNMPKMLNNYYYFTATDVSVTVTARDIISVYNGESFTAGYAYAGTACTDLKVAITEDTPGTYDGIWLFSHELAHVLGAQHDSEGPISNIKGHPGAYSCSWDDGYIMSYIDTNPINHARFSYCTQLQIRHTVHAPGRECLRRIDINDTVKIIYKLPSEMITLDNFCKYIRRREKGELLYEANKGQEKCKVYCKEQRRQYSWIFDRPEGFGCGNNAVCYLGRCTTRPNLRGIYWRHAYRLDIGR